MSRSPIAAMHVWGPHNDQWDCYLAVENAEHARHERGRGAVVPLFGEPATEHAAPAMWMLVNTDHGYEQRTYARTRSIIALYHEDAMGRGVAVPLYR
jgi:hypothetical protein